MNSQITIIPQTKIKRSINLIKRVHPLYAIRTPRPGANNALLTIK